MTENKCKSLDNLLPIAGTKLSHTQFPERFETFRNELHRKSLHLFLTFNSIFRIYR